MSTTPSSASQTDRAVLTLRELLLRGEFPAGSRLTELSLVPRLGASRTPVRHALGRLEHEGLLEAQPAGGYRVRSFTIEEIWDAIEVRGVLEGTAARLAAERLEDVHELDPLRRLVSAMEGMIPRTISTFVEYLEINDAFHLELRRLSRSPMLLRTMDAVLSLPFAHPSALVFGSLDAGVATRTAIIALEHHRAIVDAIAHREGSRADSLAREHARMTRLNLDHALADRTLFDRMPGSSLIQRPRAV